ncbi:MAG: cytochrome bc complex cytochrome b subunit [Anaerolineales bacterium]|nr:cytochrome bc complex cytochrome b subunit [Anaerolineales bacterium]
MFKTLSTQDLGKKSLEAIDRRVRIITAGLGLNELRAVLRGDPPTEKPNPRYKVHTTSFLFHIRPRYYEKGSTLFRHTFRLGFFTTFLFLIEAITGIILMVYYTPSPAEAYTSILRLESNVPFGQLMRDMHRLAAEGMVIFTFLHMMRTFLTGSYKKDRSFTWFTGVLLLGVTLFLSFFGYLLPWDQLAYWAVTIGTGMAEAAPLLGDQLNLLLRGAPDIGAGGLLRAYLLHVVLLPAVAVLLISIHYYKVSREHGISLPASIEEGNVSPEVKKEARQRIDYIPDLLTHEVFLTALGLLALVVSIVIFGYSAPLEHIANPQQTPLDTKAPWYFWWLQGMLKLGDKTLMGVILPTVIAGLLIGVPYIDRNPHRSLYRRPFAVGIGLLFVFALLVLSYMGTPRYAIQTPAATRILQDLAPEEGLGTLRAVPYAQLQTGVYEVGETIPKDLCPNIDYGCPDLTNVFAGFARRVQKAATDASLPKIERLPNATAAMIIEDWQQDLKKVTLRIVWEDLDTGAKKTYERHIYLHRYHGE